MGVAAPIEARAACPGTFSTAVCDPNMNGVGVCRLTGSQTIECDVARDPDANDTTSFYVLTSNTLFKGYGYESSTHAKFCCELQISDACANPVTLTAYGSDYRDAMNLTDTVTGTNMYCSTSSVRGGADDDAINGSTDATGNQFDILYGEDGADVINGYEGDDTLDGGAGPDLLNGNNGDDTMVGGAADDIMYGGAGADYMEGDAGDDKMKGGAGNESLMSGGSGDDWVCGEADNDVLHGNDGDYDIVMGGTGTDTNDGGVGSNDECEAENVTNCEASGTECPW